VCQRNIAFDADMEDEPCGRRTAEQREVRDDREGGKGVRTWVVGSHVSVDCTLKILNGSSSQYATSTVGCEYFFDLLPVQRTQQ
jgi:hypothetical protein